MEHRKIRCEGQGKAPVVEIRGSTIPSGERATAQESGNSELDKCLGTNRSDRVCKVENIPLSPIPEQPEEGTNEHVKIKSETGALRRSPRNRRNN